MTDIADLCARLRDPKVDVILSAAVEAATALEELSADRDERQRLVDTLTGQIDGFVLRAQAAEAKVARLRGIVENSLKCTPAIRDGEIIYDCGDPWELLRSALP